MSGESPGAVYEGLPDGLVYREANIVMPRLELSARLQRASPTSRELFTSNGSSFQWSVSKEPPL